MLRALLWTDPLIAILTVCMGSLSLLASIVDGTGRWQHTIARQWARWVLAAGGVKVTVTGLENLTPGATYVFCSNHHSLIDTPLVFGYLPWEFRVLAKKSLWKIPFLGWHLGRAGHLPVAKDNVRASIRNLADAARRVGEGVSIVVFPEGGRSPDGNLCEFRPGGAYIAIKAGVPVVPMCIRGTRAVLQIGSIIVRPGQVELRLGSPISTTGMNHRDVDRLLAELRARILDLIGQPALTRSP